MSEKKEVSDNSDDIRAGEEGKNIPVEQVEKECDENVEVADVKNTVEYRELNDKFLRLAAELENYKKRTSREYSRLIETAESGLILELLHVVDDLARALKHNDDDDKANFRQGIEMIAAKLDELLKRKGVKAIEAVGKHFDPNYHEAIMQLEVDDKADGVIIEEVQTGYFLNDKVLRPARVVVAKRISEQQTENENDTDD